MEGTGRIHRRGNEREPQRQEPRRHDFWSVVGQTELQLYKALAERKFTNAGESLERDYQDLYRRVSAPWMWPSVYDTTNFVLKKYLVGAPAKQIKAAEALLACLATFAQPK